MGLSTRELVAAALCASTAGCSGTSIGTGTQQDGGASAASSGASTANALSCAGIIECAAQCAGRDAACSDQCVASGTPHARDAVDTVVGCVARNACTDVACFQKKCTKELEACIASPSGAGEPLSGAPPTGDVAGELIGTWRSRDDSYELTASGVASRTTEGRVGGCKSTRVETGTAVTSGTTLTLYFTSSAIEICDRPGGTAYTPNRQSFTYSVTPSTTGTKLVLTEAKCRYADPAEASRYCTTTYEQE